MLDNDQQKNLRRIGIALIVIGALDIGVMILCILQKRAYSSSLNIFAVIAGALLLRGNLKPVRWISLLSAVFLAMGLGTILLSPFLMPLSLMLAYLRVRPLWSLGKLAQAFLPPAVLGWILYALRRPAILAELEENGIRSWQKIVPAAFSLALAVTVAGGGAMSFFMRRNPSVHQALAEARKQKGPGYRYAPTAFNMSIHGEKKFCAAVITAYNSRSVEQTVLEWQEPPGLQPSAMPEQAPSAPAPTPPAPAPPAQAAAPPQQAPAKDGPSPAAGTPAPKPAAAATDKKQDAAASPLSGNALAPASIKAAPVSAADNDEAATAAPSPAPASRPSRIPRILDECSTELNLLCKDARDMRAQLRCLRENEAVLMTACREAFHSK